MHCATRAVWAQFELLLLQQRVLYVKSAAHTAQAKLRMTVPKQLVEQALVEVHDGVAGAHLGRMRSLIKIYILIYIFIKKITPQVSGHIGLQNMRVGEKQTWAARCCLSDAC